VFYFPHSRVLLGFSKEYPFQWSVLIMLAMGRCIYQVIENLDTLMDRTKTNQFLRKNVFFSIVVEQYTIVGITLYMINLMFDFYISYTSVYTPLKGHIIIFVGAFENYFYVRLGCCNRRFWDRSWNIILNSIFFWQFLICRF
jgi:protoheme IX farnesyltransferase